MRLGLIVAAITLALDQASKLYLIDLMQRQGPTEVTSFFNLVMVWNRGVSFGRSMTTRRPNCSAGCWPAWPGR